MLPSPDKIVVPGPSAPCDAAVPVVTSGPGTGCSRTHQSRKSPRTQKRFGPHRSRGECFGSGAENAFGPLGTQTPQPGSNGAGGSSDTAPSSFFFAAGSDDWPPPSRDGLTLGIDPELVGFACESDTIEGVDCAIARPVPAKSVAIDATIRFRMAKILFQPERSEWAARCKWGAACPILEVTRIVFEIIGIAGKLHEARLPITFAPG